MVELRQLTRNARAYEIYALSTGSRHDPWTVIESEIRSRSLSDYHQIRVCLKMLSDEGMVGSYARTLKVLDDVFVLRGAKRTRIGFLFDTIAEKPSIVLLCAFNRQNDRFSERELLNLQRLRDAYRQLRHGTEMSKASDRRGNPAETTTEAFP